LLTFIAKERASLSRMLDSDSSKVDEIHISILALLKILIKTRQLLIFSRLLFEESKNQFTYLSSPW